VSEQHSRFTFPEHLPPSLSDPAVIAAHDWSAFCAVDLLRNHWDRPGWTPGRCSYHWFITLDDQPALIDLALDAGYADQAHMTAEVTRLAGLSPVRFLKDRTPTAA